MWAEGPPVIAMEWPSTLADGDALIVREETTDGPRFVVHSRRGPQLACRTYAEAETRAMAYAERAHAQAWYRDGGGFQLISSGERPGLVARRGAVGGTPSPTQHE